MMERPTFNFTEPKRKRGALNFETGPFPVPIQTLTGIPSINRQWSYYEGRLIGNAVHICSQDDMNAVYQMGFFGKGNLSWSSPDYNVAVGKDRRIQKKSRDESFLRLLSRRRYRKHMDWKNGSETETTGSTSLENSGEASCMTNSSSSVAFVSSEKNYSASPAALQAASIDERSLESACVLEDESGDVLVREDTEDEELGDVAPESTKSKRLKKETVAVDPFPLKESLQLGLEEAFFLSYGLGCLVVSDNNKKCMNLQEMWDRFSQLCPKFVSRYVAYHHFRSKGWVVKPGIKYGVDFILYKKGPPFYHSSYSVVVVAVDEANRKEEKTISDWTSLCCLNRVTEQVSKELMLCHIIKPKDTSDEEIRSPQCISKFKVSEFIIHRWVSKKERENAEYMEMP